VLSRADFAQKKENARIRLFTNATSYETDVYRFVGGFRNRFDIDLDVAVGGHSNCLLELGLEQIVFCATSILAPPDGGVYALFSCAALCQETACTASFYFATDGNSGCIDLFRKLTCHFPYLWSVKLHNLQIRHKAGTKQLVS
jgi:hypothetical protein